MNGPNEIMYNVNSLGLMLLLLAAMALSIYFGTRLGKHRVNKTTPEGRAQASALQGSLLGLLALLLGFCFSLALGRYDDRSAAVVSEANAIGTAWLRTDLLAEPARSELRTALKDYASARVEAGRIDLTQLNNRRAYLASSDTYFARAWAIASRTARDTPTPATVAMTNALNDMTDAFSSRDAALNRHVPEPVLFLMFGTFLFLGWVLGYSSRVAGERPSPPMYAMVLLIVLVMTVIIDLDRPRRGVITIAQTAMEKTDIAITAEFNRDSH